MNVRHVLMAGRKKKVPRPPDVLRKGGPMKDKTKYDRKRDKEVPQDVGPSEVPGGD